MDDIRGDLLRPPHGTTPAVVKQIKCKSLILWMLKSEIQSSAD